MLHVGWNCWLQVKATSGIEMCINFPPIDVEDDCSYYPFCIFCEKLYRSFSVGWKFFFSNSCSLLSSSNFNWTHGWLGLLKEEDLQSFNIAGKFPGLNMSLPQFHHSVGIRVAQHGHTMMASDTFALCPRCGTWFIELVFGFLHISTSKNTNWISGLVTRSGDMLYRAASYYGMIVMSRSQLKLLEPLDS